MIPKGYHYGNATRVLPPKASGVKSSKGYQWISVKTDNK